MDSDSDTLAGGLPHSEIPGSTIARISPGLFAACHVLHRLSVPRHPPNALCFALEHHTQRQRSELHCCSTLSPPNAADSLLEDTFGHAPACRRRAFQPGDSIAGRARLGHVQLASSPFNQQTRGKRLNGVPRMTLHAESQTTISSYISSPPEWWR
jgi:hypothetical protein